MQVIEHELLTPELKEAVREYAYSSPVVYKKEEIIELKNRLDKVNPDTEIGVKLVETYQFLLNLIINNYNSLGKNFGSAMLDKLKKSLDGQ